MSIEQDFLQIQKTVETLQRDIERAKGAKAQIQKQLKDEFGCSTLQEAKELLQKTEKERGKLEEQLEKDIELFKEQYGHLLQRGTEKD